MQRYARSNHSLGLAQVSGTDASHHLDPFLQPCRSGKQPEIASQYDDRPEDPRGPGRSPSVSASPVASTAYFLDHWPLSSWIHQPGLDLPRQLFANSLCSSPILPMSRLFALMISV